MSPGRHLDGPASCGIWVLSFILLGAATARADDAGPEPHADAGRAHGSIGLGTTWGLDRRGLVFDAVGETVGGLLLGVNLSVGAGLRTELYAGGTCGYAVRGGMFAPYAAAGLGFIGYGDYAFAEPQYTLWRRGLAFTPEIGLIVGDSRPFGRLRFSVEMRMPFLTSLQRGGAVREQSLDSSPWVMWGLRLST